ncbi:Kynurenine--oxoglutarate transaminase 3-like protein, partial [Leptotrombidium deliense]
MDEVYEWIVFDDNKHIRMNTLPEMWERTITVCSAGKSFSVTGWRIGFAYGPEELIEPSELIHENIVSECVTPIQEAIAIAYELEFERFNTPLCYWKQLSTTLQEKRDILVNLHRRVHMDSVIPEAGYFLIADFSKLAHQFDYSGEDVETKDWKFAKWLSKNKKLHGIPPSAFYSNQNKKIAENFIRFCFAKKDDTLKNAEK